MSADDRKRMRFSRNILPPRAFFYFADVIITNGRYWQKADTLSCPAHIRISENGRNDL
jgi:hypothetical protein